MISLRERDWRREAAGGVLYFRVRDGCQRARRMNEDMFEAAVQLLLLKGNWQLVTWSWTGSRLR